MRLKASDYDKNILTLRDLPQKSTNPEGFYLNNLEFTHASLSPDEKKIALSVHGAVHDWAGIFELETNKIQQLCLLT